MSQVIEKTDLLKMSVDERLDLIQTIWDSLGTEELRDAVPGWHEEEISKRLARAQAHPEESIPWGDLRDELLDLK